MGTLVILSASQWSWSYAESVGRPKSSPDICERHEDRFKLHALSEQFVKTFVRENSQLLIEETFERYFDDFTFKIQSPTT